MTDENIPNTDAIRKLYVSIPFIIGFVSGWINGTAMTYTALGELSQNAAIMLVESGVMGPFGITIQWRFVAVFALIGGVANFIIYLHDFGEKIRGDSDG